jgi:hypothetical protein
MESIPKLARSQRLEILTMFLDEHGYGPQYYQKC